MPNYTDQEMLARQEALRNVRSLDDLKTLLDGHAVASTPASNGKVMTARFPGKCEKCGVWIQAGTEVFYNFDSKRVSHTGECPVVTIVETPAVAASAPVAVSSTPLNVMDGIYTIERVDGSYRTLRLRSIDKGNLAGKRIVSYLSGADNETDYIGFAFLADNGTVKMWSRYAANTELRWAAEILTSAEKAEAAGLAYALKSGNCYRCGRTLTVPTSLHRGLGPVCAGRIEGKMD